MIKPSENIDVENSSVIFLSDFLNIPSYKVHGALLTVSVIYGVFYVVVKMLLTELTQSELIFLRFMLTAVVVTFLEWRFFRTEFAGWENVVKVGPLGTLGVFLVHVLLVVGISHTTAFHSALIMATIPIQTLIISFLIGREPYHPVKVFGVLLAFAGVFLLIFAQKTDLALPEHYIFGDLLILTAAFAFSWFLIGSQSLLKNVNAYSLMAYCYIISSLLYFFTFIGLEVSQHGLTAFDFISEMSPRAWWLMGYVVVFASIGTYTLNNFALARSTPSLVASYAFIQPVLAAVLGFYLLGESFNSWMAVAAVCTIAGVFIASKQQKVTLRPTEEVIDEDAKRLENNT